MSRSAPAQSLAAPSSSSEREEARRLSRGVAWPTLGLALVVLSATPILWLTVQRGVLPLGAASTLAVVVAYLAFTVMHEVAHGNVHGDVGVLKPVAEAAGWYSAVLLLAPYPLFRLLHLRHHAFTNHPDKDPDYWISASAGARLLLRSVAIIRWYYRHVWTKELASRDPTGKRALLGGSVAMLGAIAAALAVCAWTGWLHLALALWVAPGIVASAFLAVLFDWLPHHPATNQGRYLDTRVVLWPGLHFVTLGQSHHLVHHLYPRVPFFRYRRLFDAIRPQLEAQGACIEPKHR